MSPSYLRVREQVAAVLYVRNRCEGEVRHLRARLACLAAHGDAAEACRAELTRAEVDLAMAERDADAAREHLFDLRAAMRAEERARLRVRASEIVAALDAEREVERAIRT